MIAVETPLTKLPPAPLPLSVLTKLDSFFKSEEIPAFIVGGFLRDWLLGRKTADIDIAAKADAFRVSALLAEVLGGSYVPLDEENGIARVVVKDAPNGCWQIDINGYSGGIENDLSRRDFSINAMAVSLAQAAALKVGGETAVIDPFGGLTDLKKKAVRATDVNIFKADPLRLLRAVRLAAELNFKIDAATDRLIKEQASLICTAAPERCREELGRLLELPLSGWLWPYIDELGLLTTLIPELETLRGVEQSKEHTWDVLNHSLKSIASLDFILRQSDWPYASNGVLDDVPWFQEIVGYFAQKVNGLSLAALTRLAALLHDIAKPQTRIITEDGRLRFFGHADKGAFLAENTLKRLRFSRKQTELVSSMVGAHLRPVQMGQPGEMPSKKAVYRYFRDLGQAGVATLYLSLADHLATRGPDLEKEFWQHHTEVVKFAINQHNMQQKRITPSKVISGDDIIKHFGLEPGPLVGQLLEMVHEAHAAGEVTNREEALALVAEVWQSKKESTDKT